MLHIRKLEHLARPLETTPQRLVRLAESASSYVDEYLCVDPSRTHKVRDVIGARGLLRDVQTRLYRRVLLPKLLPSRYSHGGVVGRNVKTNVRPHQRSRYVLKSDISDFYPSVHYRRVYRLFTEALGCSPDVARVCTLLTTYQHHLALGLVTSPILADHLLHTVDQRLGTACEVEGLVYTRYVDDVTISGSFDLQPSGFASLVERILREHGFRVNPRKHQFGCLAQGFDITGIRVAHGRLDAIREYVVELERQLDDAASLAGGGVFVGPFYTWLQIHGRVQFVAWVNPGRSSRLHRRLGSINRDAHVQESRRRGLVVIKKRLIKKAKGPATKRESLTAATP